MKEGDEKYKILITKCKGKKYSKDLDTDEMLILKWTLKM
jgi:hypothetical protein